MSRNRFRGGGRYNSRGGGGRGRGNRSSGYSNNSKKTELKDHWYYIGSETQAANFDVTNEFVLNHILTTYKRSKDIHQALTDLEQPDFNDWKPKLKKSTATDPAEKARQDEEFKIDYGRESDSWTKRTTQYEENSSNAYGLIWGRCVKLLKQKIETRKDFKTNILRNPINLLTAIREHSMNYEETKYNMEIVFNSMRAWVNCRQKPGESLIDYTRRFTTARELLESHMGSPIILYKLVEADPIYDKTKPDEVTKLIKKYDERLHAYAHLANADQEKYRSLIRRLRQDVSLKDDSLKKDIFPTTITGSTNALSRHPHDEKKQTQVKSDQDKKEKDKDEIPTLSFAQAEVLAKLEGKCYCCGKPNHKSPQCRNKDSIPRSEWAINKISATETNTQAAHVDDKTKAEPEEKESTAQGTSNSASNKISWAGVHVQQAFAQQGFKDDFKHWILLDSDSNTTLFCNRDYTTKIWEDKESMSLQTNGDGKMTTNYKAHVPLIGTTWFNEESMTNIIAMADMADLYRVTMDTSEENCFLVHLQDRIIRFVQMTNRLYAMDPRDPSRYIIKQNKWKGEPFDPQYVAKRQAKKLSTTTATKTIQDAKAFMNYQYIVSHGTNRLSVFGNIR